MSRSFRDQDRRISKILNKDMNRSFSDGSPDIAEKVEKCRNSKNVFRYGNNRKAISLQKKQDRRSERRKNNLSFSEIE